MKKLMFCYVVILLLGISIIELRIGPIWSRGTLAGRLPAIAAVVDWTFFPGQIQYVAVTNLKASHQLEAIDFKVNPQLDRALYGYLPAKSELIGKYLQTGIDADKVIRLDTLSAEKPAKTDSIYVLHVQVPNESSSQGLFKPKSKVAICLRDSLERLEGAILSAGWEPSSDPPEGQPPNGDDLKKDRKLPDTNVSPPSSGGEK